MDIDKVLKILFILSASALLFSLLYFPQTDCDACKINYKGNVIDGYEAFKIFENSCISYAKSWDYIEPVDISYKP